MTAFNTNMRYRFVLAVITPVVIHSLRLYILLNHHNTITYIYTQLLCWWQACDFILAVF